MSALAIALSLFLQAQPAAEPAPEAPPPPAAEAPAAAQPDAPPEDPWPAGVPHDDYQLVAWCYGALRGYLELHDEVMPEVTRIETTFRPPGRKLSDDLKVYADMQKAGTKQLKQFQGALTAAEKASLKPINTVGAAAVAKGRSVWEGGPGVTKARMAQEWMSWALPAKCETTAKALQERATLMGAGFKVNSEAEPEAPTAEAASAETPTSEPGKTPTEGAPAQAPAPEAQSEPKP
jgi:hypothetical protein